MQSTTLGPMTPSTAPQASVKSVNAGTAEGSGVVGDVILASRLQGVARQREVEHQHPRTAARVKPHTAEVAMVAVVSIDWVGTGSIKGSSQRKP